MHRKTLLPASLLALSLLLPALAGAQGQGVWARKADAGGAHYNGSLLPLNGKLYMLGGFQSYTNPAADASVEAYHPATDTWTSRAPLNWSPAREYIRGVAANGRIYAVAQATTGMQAYSIKVYDEATNSWSDRATSPDYYHYYRNFRPVAVGDKIFIFAGKSLSDKYPFIYIDVFDLSTNAWSHHVAGSGSQSWNDEAAWVEAGGKVYCIAGTYLGLSTTARTLEYNPATGAWTAKADIPVPTSYNSAAVLNGSIYVMGGTAAYGDPNEPVRVFNPAANSWGTQPAMLSRRYGVGAAELGGRLYAQGGSQMTPFGGIRLFEELSFPVPAAYVRIRSRWLGTYLHLENRTGFVQNGAAPAFWWSSQWAVEPSGQGWVRLRNRWTHEYMHVENLTGRVQAGPIQPTWDSAKWFIDTFGAYKRLRNLWNGHFIHIENNNGFAQHGSVYDVWESAQWTLEAVP